MLKNTTKINTESMYKVTDELLNGNFEYKHVNNNLVSYTLNNVRFDREKIPLKYSYYYKFIEYNNNEKIREYNKKTEIKELIMHIQRLAGLIQ